ncbi:unnamed protein product [Closterium sp. NIES-53]
MGRSAAAGSCTISCTLPYSWRGRDLLSLPRARSAAPGATRCFWRMRDLLRRVTSRSAAAGDFAICCCWRFRDLLLLAISPFFLPCPAARTLHCPTLPCSLRVALWQPARRPFAALLALPCLRRPAAATARATAAGGAGGAGPPTDCHCMSWPISRQLQWLGVDSGGHCLSQTTPPLSSFASEFFSEPVQAAALGASKSAATLGASESAAALGARESAAALGARASPATGPSSAEALHTFTLDSGAPRCFFRDCTSLTPLAALVPVSLADPTEGPVVARASTVLPCPAVPSGSLSGLHLPTFSTNLVSNAAIQDFWVDTFIPRVQRVAICTCSRTGHHLATFTRRPGSSLYTLTTAAAQVAEAGQVAASSQVSTSGQLATSCSCRVLSHQTLFWHPRLGHPSLPRQGGMQSCVLVSGLPRSLPPLPHSPAPPCLPCVEGRQGGELSFDLLADICRDEGIVQSFTLPASPQQNGIAECHIGLIMEVARTSMVHVAAANFLWPFAVRYAAHQLNLWPRVYEPETSPTLRWTGKVGDASVFRVWGALSLVCDAKASKLSSRSLRCVFLGFHTDAPPWRFYHPREHRVFSSQDVTFDESVYYYRLHLHASHPVPPAPLFLVPVPPPPIDPLPPQGRAPSGVSQVDSPPLVEPLEISSDSSGRAEGGDPAADDTAATRCSPRLETPPGFPPRPSSPPPQPAAVDSRAETAGAEPGGAETEGEGSGGAATGGACSWGAVTGGAYSVGPVRPSGGGAVRDPTGGPGAGQPPQPDILETLSSKASRAWIVQRGSPGGGGYGHAGAGATSPGGTAGAGGTGGAAGAGCAGATSPRGATGAARARPTSRGGIAGARGARTRGARAARAGGAVRAGGATGAAGSGGTGGTTGAGGAGAAGAGATASARGAGGATGAAGTGGAGGAAGAGGARAGGTGGAVAAGPGGARTRGTGAAGAGGAGGTTGARGPGATELVVLLVLEVLLELLVLEVLVLLVLEELELLVLPCAYLFSTHSRSRPCRHLIRSFARFLPETRASTPVRARRVARPRPPAVLGTHGMALRPSSIPHRVVLPEPPASSLPHVPDPESDLARAANPTATRLLATVVIDPDLESTVAFALVAELVDFALRSRLNYVASLVTESESVYPPSVVVYVDDLVFATVDTEALALVKAELQERHTCTDLGPSALCLPVLLATTHSSVYRPLALSSTFGRVRRAEWSVLRACGLPHYIGHGAHAWRTGFTCTHRTLRRFLGRRPGNSAFAGAMAAQELRWVTYLLTDLGERPRSPPVLYVDNKAMIALCHEQRLEHRTKHIALREFLAHELQQRRQLRLSFMASGANTADVFTKDLGLVPTLLHLLVA